MADLVVIVPSRGRPEAAWALLRAFRDTCTANTALAFAIDADDPRLNDYVEAIAKATVDGTFEQALWWINHGKGAMVAALNGAVDSLLASDASPEAIAFLGDDHCPRTLGWDAAYLDALRELGTGIVYGNDLLQGHRLPTQCAMTSDIVRALGYMSPPMLRHLYVDNYWRDLGKGAECLKYLPEVIVEHRHPLAGKAQWDEGYQRVNAQEVASHDAQAYEAFAADGRLAADVAKVRALRGAA